MNDNMPISRIIRQALFVSVLTITVSFCLAPQHSAARPGLHTGATDEMPGTAAGFSRDFNPVFLKGLKIDPDDPLRFEFVLDPGDTELTRAEFEAETAKIVDYFFAALKIPEEDLWVDLSPYEHQKVIAPDFAKTRMGHDLLAQDLLLKQVAASVLYPVSDLGREFWLQLTHRAQQQFGSADLPVNTFSKIWIVPRVAAVHVEDGAAYVVGSYMRVVLEEDLPIQNNPSALAQFRLGNETASMHDLIHEIMRDIVLPELEEEVNFGENFVELRQIYNTLILAQWYKRSLRGTALSEVDLDRLNGGDFFGKKEADKIYRRYLRYLEGEVVGMQKRMDTRHKAAPRPYFSGGVQFGQPLVDVYLEVDDPGLYDYDSSTLAGTVWSEE